MLLEVLVLCGAWGPLCGHFKPMTGNVRYWTRPGTHRLAPWPGKVPFTGGDTRTPGDVALFVAVLASLVLPLAVQAQPVDGFPGQEIVPGWTFVPVLVLVLMPLMGLRDKAVFLAGRSEQYLPIMLYSCLLSGSFVDMIVAFKNRHRLRLAGCRGLQVRGLLPQRGPAHGLRQPRHPRQGNPPTALPQPAPGTSDPRGSPGSWPTSAGPRSR